MPIRKTDPQQNLEQQIADLEAETKRVSALSTTSEANRADLSERLQRLKDRAAQRS